jgi:hypothetical protein
MDFEWSELSEIQIKGSELNCIPDMILTLLSFYPPLGGTSLRNAFDSLDIDELERAFDLLLLPAGRQV